MGDERFDIDVGYRDPDDRRDDFPVDKPSPAEYEDDACQDRTSPGGFPCWRAEGLLCPQCRSDEGGDARAGVCPKCQAVVLCPFCGDVNARCAGT